MRTLRWLTLGAALLTVCAVVGAPRPSDLATTERLGGPTRFLTHVSTDKPIYKIGETAYVRGVVLDAKSRVPAPNGHYAQVTLKGPKGETIATGSAQVLDGAFGYSWKVPEGQAGGEYTLLATGSWGQAPGERKFDVRVYRAPRLKSQITFARDGYGAGDTLTATLETTRAEGGIPKGARITAVARVDEVDVASAPCGLDDKGRCTVSLKLPAAIERGEGVLSFTIEDGGVVETATKTIPLLVRSFEVAVFPEGGDLVAGLRSRVYLEARTLAKKPADIAGVVVDSKGKEITTFRTEHEGRGRFQLAPEKGETYTLRITEPASVKKTVTLPPVAAEGAAITSASDVVPAGQPAKLTIAWTGDRVVKVTLRQRDVQLDAITVDARKQAGSPVSLDAKDAEGVLVATVFTKEGTPLAERLLFRESKQQLQIELKADRDRYVPGADVTLTLRTLVDGRPAPAMVGLTVTDDSVHQLIEKREQAPSLPVMVYLESDVRELADAHVYLDAKHPKSKLAVDLLLGTQGWRRFATFSVADFLATHQDAARRALAFSSVASSATSFDSGRDLTKRRRNGAPQAAVFGAPPPMPPPAPLAPPLPPAAAPPGRPLAQAQAPLPGAQADLPDDRRQAAPQDLKKEDVARDEVVDREAREVEMAQPKILALEAAPEEKDAERPRRSRAPSPVPVITVREYAHHVRPARQPNDRLDFAETLYWAAAVRTNASGVATVKFGTSDAVTSLRRFGGGRSQARLREAVLRRAQAAARGHGRRRHPAPHRLRQWDASAARPGGDVDEHEGRPALYRPARPLPEARRARASRRRCHRRPQEPNR
jgi:hypothetical protein